MRTCMGLLLGLAVAAVPLARGADDEPVPPAKIKAWVRDLKSDKKRDDAIATLVGAGTQAVPEVVKALKDQNAKLREAAADTLAQIGPDAEGAVDALIPLLKDKVTGVRGAAAEALGSIG